VLCCVVLCCVALDGTEHTTVDCGRSGIALDHCGQNATHQEWFESNRIELS